MKLIREFIMNSLVDVDDEDDDDDVSVCLVPTTAG